MEEEFGVELEVLQWEEIDSFYEDYLGGGVDDCI
jgi:hypothetical protein